ncbi:hypothetical protein GCM10022226_53830 [Sphaerisporangium flaviroseum]|uniref:Uncharacterized protein n=1 Tax=Sphaerisporangium flaviroseum TaxID=509199 RepID=A0ABP7ITY5_9ACTN
MMKRIWAITLLLAVMAVGSVVTGGGAQAARKTTVSMWQYRTMVRQCRYANTPLLRRHCRDAVRRHYRVGRRNIYLDCRTYSGISVCGRLVLTKRERRCVTRLVREGLSRRRAEVECYAFE